MNGESGDHLREPTPGDHLREHPYTPDPVHIRLALMEGRAVSKRTALGRWIEAGDLDNDVVEILRAALLLRYYGVSERWTQARQTLEMADHVAVRAWGVWHGYPEVEDLEAVEAFHRASARDGDAFQTVDARFALIERATKEAEETLEAAGYRWEDGLVEVGRRGRRGRGGALLNPLVRGALLAEKATENTYDLRRRLALELAPLFPSRVVSTRRGSPLYNAVRERLRGH